MKVRVVYDIPGCDFVVEKMHVKVAKLTFLNFSFNHTYTENIVHVLKEL